MFNDFTKFILAALFCAFFSRQSIGQSLEPGVYGRVIEKSDISLDLKDGAPIIITKLPVSEIPGLLRFRLRDVPEKLEWQIKIFIPGQPKPILLTQADWHLREVYKDVIEIEIQTSGDITAIGTPNSPRISYTELVVLPSPSNQLAAPLYKNGAINLDYLLPTILSPANPENLRPLSIGRAVVNLRYTGEGISNRCTAFQFAEGYYLTNLHCVTTGSAVINKDANITLEFGEYNAKDAKVTTRATIKAIGRGGKKNTRWPLDYAVLTANTPSEYKDAIIPLAFEIGTIEAGTPLELYQVWTGPQKMAGKAISRDDQCRIVPTDVSQGQCSTEDITDQCDTEGGSSGSPIIRKDEDVVLALHYWGVRSDRGNCAIPINRIFDDIRPNNNYSTKDKGVTGGLDRQYNDNSKIWAELSKTPTMIRYGFGEK